MVVYRSIDSIKSETETVLTMGTYDGLHRGHQEIIRKVVTLAKEHDTKSVLVTYYPHPRHVLNQKEDKLPILIELDKKLELLESLGIDIVLIIPFDQEFSKISKDDFIQNIIISNFSPREIIVGYDHHFGFNREGSPEFLLEYGKEHEISVHVQEPVKDEGTTLSSTRIRELISDGFIRRANFELGLVFGFSAEVVHGSGRGRTLNFPTANFVPVGENQLLPKQGVYLTRGRVEDGHLLYGMCNLGTRPTFDEGDFVMEVHFINSPIKTTDHLFGQTILIEFLERIREEKKFDSRFELIEQLNRDQKVCLELIEKYK